MVIGYIAQKKCLGNEFCYDFDASGEPKGLGEEGASRRHPEIWSQKVADFECR